MRDSFAYVNWHREHQSTSRARFIERSVNYLSVCAPRDTKQSHNEKGVDAFLFKDYFMVKETRTHKIKHATACVRCFTKAVWKDDFIVFHAKHCVELHLICIQGTRASQHSIEKFSGGSTVSKGLISFLHSDRFQLLFFFLIFFSLIHKMFVYRGVP